MVLLYFTVSFLLRCLASCCRTTVVAMNLTFSFVIVAAVGRRMHRRCGGWGGGTLNHCGAFVSRAKCLLIQGMMMVIS